MVNKERVELWVQALESDGYNKCVGSLRVQSPIHGKTMHCVEGVAMAVAEAHGLRIHETAWFGATMPPYVRNWYGIEFNAPIVIHDDEYGKVTAIGANDSAGRSFWEIAQMIRAKYLKGEES